MLTSTIHVKTMPFHILKRPETREDRILLVKSMMLLAVMTGIYNGRDF